MLEAEKMKVLKYLCCFAVILVSRQLGVYYKPQQLGAKLSRVVGRGQKHST